MKLSRKSVYRSIRAFGAVSFLLIAACAHERDTTPSVAPAIDSILNTITISADDEIIWNDTTISLAQLQALLKHIAAMEPEPELQWEPRENASYEQMAVVLMAIKQSGVTKFGFIGNDSSPTD